MTEPLTASERNPAPDAPYLRTAGVAIALAAGLVLLGWAVEMPVARSLMPGWRAMAPTSALCFIFLGTALAVSSSARRGLPAMASVALAIAVATLTLATLHEYATGTRSGIETWGGLWQFTDDGVSGRMSPMTALELLTLATGVAAVMLPGAVARTVARLAAGAALFAAWLAVVALSIDASRLADVPRFPGMAVPTVLFAVLTGACVMAMTTLTQAGRLASRSGVRWPIWSAAVAFVAPPAMSRVYAALLDSGAVEPQLLTAATALAFSILLALLAWRFASRLAAAQRARALTLIELEARVEQRTLALTVSNDELRRHQETLREADRRKDDFLMMLAHELRNPLAPIRTAAHIIGAGQGTFDQQRRAAAIIERQVALMRRLIDDLLDVSRLAADNFQIRPARVALAEVIDFAVATVRPTVDEMAQELTVTAPGDIHVDADAARLAQALSNLLLNASRFTPAHGHIMLSTQLAADGMVEVTVRDDGIGIEPAFLPHLFEKFAQARPGAGRTQGGLGLGLALAQGIVARHGGSVTGTSEGPGTGSTFVVRLPVVTAAAASAAGPAADIATDIATVTAADEAAVRPVATPVSAERRRRVLIVDDNEDNVAALATLLGLDGHEVTTAFDAATALALAEQARPSVMLIDLGMPGMDGYELCRQVRATAWGAQVLLIAQTGFGQARDRQRSRDAGFDWHLTKPVEIDELRRLLTSPRETRHARAS